MACVTVFYPRANAPDHCRRKPKRAEIKIALEFRKSQLKDSTPGGSSNGISGSRKKIVIGVVFHINLRSSKPTVRAIA